MLNGLSDTQTNSYTAQGSLGGIVIEFKQ